MHITYTDIYTYMSPVYIHMQTHMYLHTYIYINPNNPLPTPNMQMLAGYLLLKLIFKSYQKANSNSNIQSNDIEKSFY